MPILENLITSPRSQDIIDYLTTNPTLEETDEYKRYSANTTLPDGRKARISITDWFTRSVLENGRTQFSVRVIPTNQNQYGVSFYEEAPSVTLNNGRFESSSLQSCSIVLGTKELDINLDGCNTVKNLPQIYEETMQQVYDALTKGEATS